MSLIPKAILIGKFVCKQKINVHLFVNLFSLKFRALFGYEGHTNILKVVSTGNGGLIELTDELNSGKILYAFVKIANDKANLTKYLLVNWQVNCERSKALLVSLLAGNHEVSLFFQGEGAPTNRKGTCANHIRDISKILTGAHLTLNARTEDDIDSDRILEKLNSIRFAVKENRPRIEDGNAHFLTFQCILLIFFSLLL